jgi:hypothetical protein
MTYIASVRIAVSGLPPSTRGWEVVMRSSIAFIALCCGAVLIIACNSHAAESDATDNSSTAYNDAELYALIASDLAHDDATGRAAYQEDLDRIWLQIEANPEASLREVAAGVFCSLRYGEYSPNAITQRLEIWIQRDPLNAYPAILAGITRNQALDYDGAIAYFNRIEPAMFCDDYLGEIVHHYLRDGVHEITPIRMKIDSLDHAIWPCLKTIQNYIISGTRGAIIQTGPPTEHGLLTLYAESILFRSMVTHELPNYLFRALEFWWLEIHMPVASDGNSSTSASVINKYLMRPGRYAENLSRETETLLRCSIGAFGQLDSTQTWSIHLCNGESMQDIRWDDAPGLTQHWQKHLDATTQPLGEVGERPVIDEWLCQSSPNKPHGRRPPPSTPRRPPSENPSD